jgi:hypothetical protein
MVFGMGQGWKKEGLKVRGRGWGRGRSWKIFSPGMLDRAQWESGSRE